MKKRAFTLIELIVVIAIIAILSAIIAPNAFRAIEKAKIASTIVTVRALKSALYNYYADTGRWPPAQVSSYYIDPNRLLQNDGTPGWDGPYLEKWSSRHPWGGTWAIRNDEIAEGAGINPATIDILLVLNNDGPIDVSDASMQRIDAIIDDGNLSTANVVSSCSAAGDCELKIGVAVIGQR